MNFKDNSNLRRKKKIGDRNTEDALWGYKYREFNRVLSLSLLTWSPCSTRMINIEGWRSLPESEARGAVCTSPSGLRATLYLHPTRLPPKRLWFVYHIMTSTSSKPILPSLSLRLQFFLPRLLTPPRFCLPHPYYQDIQGGLLPPFTG